MTENILIDTIEFPVPLPMDYDTVIGMFSSYHDQDCCENHYLDFDSTRQDFETAKEFLSKVDKIELKGVEGMGINIRMYDYVKDSEFGIFVPGRASNNGYYSDNLTLIVNYNGWKREYDVRTFQKDEY